MTEPDIATGRRHALRVVSAHAGGDVGRVVLGGIGNLPGRTVAGRARFLQEHADGLRQLLMNPPHGDLSHCANLVVPPAAADADVGLIIMGTMGYPGFSGSNAMCTAAALVETGERPMEEGRRPLALETPDGVSTLSVTYRSGRVESVAYDSLPGFVMAGDGEVVLEAWGTVRYSLAYGGTFYALIDATGIALDPATTQVAVLKRFFEAFFTATAPGLKVRHPEHGPVQRVTLALLVGTTEWESVDTLGVPVAAYMDPGVICRSPTGTGTTALLAWLAARGAIASSMSVRTRSPFGSEFLGTLTGFTTVADRAAVRTQISGRPHLLSDARVIVDLDDPLIADNGLSRILLAPVHAVGGANAQRPA
ncbi:proline racemase family protein [Arhodomonas sp. AD133]|uniref:proline racemase family protein n=1 Tax=Arhodomonas sp. AD133 TaxID=3415009 RepID=UPI003EB8B58C